MSAPEVTIKDDRKIYDRIVREVAKLRGTTITIGVHEDAGLHKDSGETVAQVAATHEFGAGRIPERSFLRSTIDGNPKPMIEAQKAAAAVVEGKIYARVAVERVGLITVGAVKETILSKIPPPLAPSTVQRRLEKGEHGGGLASHADALTPLVDTGQMIQSIQFKVESTARGWGAASQATTKAAK